MRWLCLLVLWFHCALAIGASCSAVFPDPVSSYHPSGDVEFDFNAMAIGSDGILAVDEVYYDKDSSTSKLSCVSAHCIASGDPSNEITYPRNFENSRGSQDIDIGYRGSDTFDAGHYDVITLSNESTLTATEEGIYHINELTLRYRSTLYLSSGTYWIGKLVLQNESNIRLLPGAKVVLLTKNNLELEYRSGLNRLDDAEPGNLLVIGYDSIFVSNEVEINGFLFAVETIRYNYRASHTGAANAKTVHLDNEATVTYAASSISLLPAEGMCDTEVTLPDPVGHWPFDVCSLTGRAGDLPDIIAGNHGTSSNLPGIKDDGKLCQAGQFRGDGDIISIPHQSSYAAADFSISFWLQTDDLNFTNEALNGGMALVSKDLRGFGSGGHFTISVTPAGAISVKQQSANTSYQLQSAPSITPGQWHHVVYTVGKDGMLLYIDNALAASSGSYKAGLSNNSALLTLAANGGDLPGPGQDVSRLRDFYKGQLDDLRLYNAQLNAQQVSLLYDLNSASCINCESSAYAVSHWDFDVCSVSGKSGEIVDTVSGFHGTAKGNVALDSNGRFCQGLAFDGDSYVEVAHQSEFAIEAGTLTFWVSLETLSGNVNERMALVSKDGLQRYSEGFFTAYVNGAGQLVFHQETSSNSDEVISSQTLSAGQWHHIAYQWDSNGMQYYIDGVFQGGYTDSEYDWSFNQQPLLFGASGENFATGTSNQSLVTDYLTGSMDDIQFYHGVMSAGEIQALYGASDYGCINCGDVAPLAHYKFEESVWNGNGAVPDSSSRNNNGTALSGVTPVLPDAPVSCRAMDIAASNDSAVTGLNTNVDINDVGPRGTISFWYRSNTPWVNGGHRQLFDASDSDSGKYFYLALTNDGELAFGMEDYNDGDLQYITESQYYPAEEWVHIAISWDIISNEVLLYVNSRNIFIGGRASVPQAGFGKLGTLIIGDNASSYLVADMTSNSANGIFDDVRIYDYEQTLALVRADMLDTEECFRVHHYEIVHPEEALTCSSAAVTVKACSDEDCNELSASPTSISLSGRSWTPAMPITFIGSRTVNLTQSSPGNVVLSFVATDSVSTPEYAAQCSGDCSIDFVAAGFEFYDTTSPYSAVLPDIVAQSDLGRIGFRLVRDDDGVCKPLLSGEQTLSLNYDCVSAGSGYSPDQCTVPFAGVAPNVPDGTSNGDVTVSFNSNGESSLAGYRYADAGRVAISLNAEVNGATIESAYALVDSIPARLLMASNEALPHTAGASFSLSITALGAHDEVLPGYSPGALQMRLKRIVPAAMGAAESQLQVANNQTVTSSVSTSWQDVSVEPFVSGKWSYNQAASSEVGSYEWDSQDANYLGNSIQADSVGGDALTFNRFIPAYFSVEAAITPQLENQCGGQFTYIGQPFGFSIGSEPELLITAYNALGQITQNYSDRLWALNPGSSGLSAVTVADNTLYSGDVSALDVGSVPVVSDYTQYNGEGAITVLDTKLVYSKIPTLAPSAGNGSPFDADITMVFNASFLTDADGVCYQTAYPGSCEAFSFSSIQGTDLRYGRLRIENTFGPETETLTAPLVTEYYDNGNWMINVQDSCTALSLSQSSGQVSIASVSEGNDEQDITSYLPGISSTGVLSAGKSPDTMINLGPAMQNGVALRGAVRITLEPAATGADWAGYLNIDWDGDGDIDTNDKPSGEAFFGIYRGNDRTIHIREGY